MKEENRTYGDVIDEVMAIIDPLDGTMGSYILEMALQRYHKTKGSVTIGDTPLHKTKEYKKRKEQWHKDMILD